MPAQPSYLLTGIPPDLREALAHASAEDGRSISSAVRSALMQHYSLAHPVREEVAERMVIRACPELFSEIKDEAEQSGKTMKQVIIDILSARYIAA